MPHANYTLNCLSLSKIFSYYCPVVMETTLTQTKVLFLPSELFCSYDITQLQIISPWTRIQRKNDWDVVHSAQFTRCVTKMAIHYASLRKWQSMTPTNVTAPVRKFEFCHDWITSTLFAIWIHSKVPRTSSAWSWNIAAEETCRIKFDVSVDFILMKDSSLVGLGNCVRPSITSIP